MAACSILLLQSSFQAFSSASYTCLMRCWMRCACVKLNIIILTLFVLPCGAPFVEGLEAGRFPSFCSESVLDPYFSSALKSKFHCFCLSHWSFCDRSWHKINFWVPISCWFQLIWFDSLWINFEVGHRAYFSFGLCCNLPIFSSPPCPCVSNFRPKRNYRLFSMKASVHESWPMCFQTILPKA